MRSSGISESVFLSPTPQNEITSVFNNLKNNTSRDISNMQIKPRKYVIDLLASILGYILNLFLQTYTFPKSMQVAKLTVLHNGGQVNNFSNYRPISILPIFFKILEKIIHSRLQNFFNKHAVFRLPIWFP